MKISDQTVLKIIGIILFAWFLCPVFAGRIVNIGNITGMIVGLLFILYGIFFNRFNAFVKNFWQKTAGKIIEIFAGLILLAIICLAVCCMVSMGRAMRPGYKNAACKALTSTPEYISSSAILPDALVVLGAKVKGRTGDDAYASLTLSNRLDEAYQYYEGKPDIICIVSGGKGAGEPAAESAVMKKYLVDKGIPEECVYEENISTNTEENIKLSSEILGRLLPENDSPVIGIVTNDYHEYRALKTADRQNIAAISVPAKTPWWLFPTYYVREMYAILELWFLK